MMPKADQSLGEISDLLGSIMNESGRIPITDIAPSDSGLNEDTIDLLRNYGRKSL